MRDFSFALSTSRNLRMKLLLTMYKQLFVYSRSKGHEHRRYHEVNSFFPSFFVLWYKFFIIQKLQLGILTIARTQRPNVLSHEDSSLLITYPGRN